MSGHITLKEFLRARDILRDAKKDFHSPLLIPVHPGWSAWAKKRDKYLKRYKRRNKQANGLPSKAPKKGANK